ncbi:MAG: alpha/beta fold hydrolase [Lishizhenia sp.]
MTKSNYLSHRIVGDGYPVVFLHGFLESSTMWNYLNLEPQQNQQFIYIDLPGHGNSTQHTATSVKEMALKVKALLQSLFIKEYSIVGHSLGGYVGLELVDDELIAPEKICLYSSHPFEDSPFRKQNRNRFIRLVEDRKDLFLEEAIPGLFHSPKSVSNAIAALIDEAKQLNFEHIQNASIAMRDRTDYRERCVQSSCEITYIGGKQDLLIDQNRLGRWIKKENIASYIIDDTAHMAHIEKTAILKEHLNTFLEQA